MIPLMDTFDVETDATKYPQSIVILYYTKDRFIFGEVYKQTVSLSGLKGNINYIKGLIGETAEAIIKVNHQILDYTYRVYTYRVLRFLYPILLNISLLEEYHESF